jgi:hypothetical protein
MLNEVTKIKGGFVRAVKIIDDFFDEELNRRKLESYYPNPSAREAFYSISEGLRPTSTARVHLVSGTYGSGKSHFGLVIANYLVKNSDSEELKMILYRIKERDPSRASEIFNIRNIDNPYLVVLLEGYDPDGAEHAFLCALQDALQDPQRGDLPEDVLKTCYHGALNKIQEWEETKPDFLGQLSDLLRDQTGQSIDEMKYSLVPGFNREAYRLFKELHFKVTTSPFMPLFSEKASRIYSQISELLVKEHGYKGIAVIWDQFNDHLESTSPSLLGKEVGFLRDLVEIVERPDNQLHLVLISHNLPHVYIRGKITKEGLDNWMTLEGRFNQHRLTAIEEAEELIDSAIVHVWDTEQGKNLKREIEEGSTRLIDGMVELDLYPDKSRDWIMDTLCKGAFPLHPVATYCLPMLSDVVGQAERTMFTYFEEATKEGGLSRFINGSEIYTGDGELNLYTAEKLFDFFREAVEGTPETAHIIRNYVEAMSKVKAPREILTQRVMKALAVVRTIETKHPTPLSNTPSNLALLLDLEESKIKPLLDSFVENDVLWVKANGEYEFRSGLAIVNLDADFRKAREGVSWDNPVAVLSAEYRPEFVVARRYTNQYRVFRALDTEYIEADGLNNITLYERRIENNYLDGILLYVVAESMSDIEKARKQAINVRHPQIVIAIPRSPLNLYEGLRNVKALDDLGREAPYNLQGTEASKIWKDSYDAEKAKLDKEVANWKAVSNLDWFRGGITLDTAEESSEDIADFVMFNVFEKTPIVEHRKVANRHEQDDRAHRLTLNTWILDTKNDEISYPAKGRVPAEKTILEQTFKPQGMLKERVEGNLSYFRIVEPTVNNMKAVWTLIKSYLTESGGRAKFTKLVRDLQLPPYGLCPRAIELFVSAFLRFHRNRISIKSKRTKTSPWEKMDFIGETIYNIVNDPDPERVLVEYREQLPLEDDYLLEVNLIVSPDKTWDSKLNAIDGVGELFATWIQNLPQVTKCNIEDEKCRIFLAQMGDADRDQDMRELLLEKLPRALGIEKGFEHWDQEALDSFRTTFKQVVDELNNYPDEVVVRKGIECFRPVFDVKGDTEYDVMPKIRNWYNNLGAAAKEHKYSGPAALLVKYANIKTADRFKEKFLIQLPKELGLGEYSSWQNTTEALANYRNLLSKSKAEIETVHVKATGEPVDKAKGLPPKAKSLKESLKQVIDKAVIGREDVILALESLLEEYRR